MGKKTVLTARQLEVLRLRAQGLSQTEIASRLGTSRANISATEHKAREKVERARNTLELIRSMEAPVRFTVEADTDLNEAVKEVYARADAAGIWVPHSFPSLANMVQKGAGEKVKGRKVLEEFEVSITGDGGVVVR